MSTFLEVNRNYFHSQAKAWVETNVPSEGQKFKTFYIHNRLTELYNLTSANALITLVSTVAFYTMGLIGPGVAFMTTGLTVGAHILAKNLLIDPEQETELRTATITDAADKIRRLNQDWKPNALEYFGYPLWRNLIWEKDLI